MKGMGTLKKSAIVVALALCALAVSCKKTDVDEKSDALIEAAMKKNSKKVARLIEAGADVNAQTKYGYTALMYAAGYNASYTAQLIKAGADVNVKDDAGHTALMYAVVKDA